jgi:hypothetical protein
VSITQAWLTARLFHSDPKKFPALEKLTGKSRGPKRQTPDEMLASVRMLKAMLQGDNDG